MPCLRQLVDARRRNVMLMAAQQAVVLQNFANPFQVNLVAEDGVEREACAPC